MKSTAVLALLVGAVLSCNCRAQCDPSWQSGLGSPGVIGGVSAMCMWDPDGNGPLPPCVVVGGVFTIAGNVTSQNVAAWNPSARTWTGFGAGTSNVNGQGNTVETAMSLPDGRLVIGGSFLTVDGVTVNSVAAWDGSAWASLAGGVTNGPNY